MLGFIEQVFEIIIDFFTDIEGLLNWIWDAVITLFNMFTTFSVSIPLFYGIYLPSGLVVVFALLGSISIVMAVMSVFGSSVRR